MKIREGRQNMDHAKGYLLAVMCFLVCRPVCAGREEIWTEVKSPNFVAQRYFSAAARLDSKSYLAQFYSAKSEYERSSDSTAAERYLRQALEINPKFVPAYDMLSHILSFQESRLPEALEMAKLAAALEPAEWKHNLNVGEILIAMGRYEEASLAARRVLALANDDSGRSLADAMLSRIKERDEQVLQAAQSPRESDVNVVRRQPKRIEEYRQEIGTGEKGKSGSPVSTNRKRPYLKLIGVVKSVKCSPPAVMDLVLESKGKRQTFHAENYYRLQYEAIGGSGKKGFAPCEELQGQTVQIEFSGVSGRDFSGFLQKIGIVK